MTQLFIEIWGVAVALWNIGQGSARRILNAARWIIRAALLVLLVWPFVVLAVAYQGQIGLTAVVAMAPIGVFFLLILIYPLVSGILAAIPQGRLVWRYLLLVVFMEVCTGLYLTLVPVWNDPQLMALLAILASVLGIFLILKGMFGWGNKWATRFAAVLTLGIFVVTVILFLGGREQVRGMGDRAVQAPPTVQVSQPSTGLGQLVAAPSLDSIKEIKRISLLGEDKPSEEVLRLPGDIPPLWYYYFEGPPEARVHYSDNTTGPISQWFGQKGGTLRFSGPKGEVVVVRAYPPPK